MQSIFPYFSQNPLDRLDSKRGDKEVFERLKNSPLAQVLLCDGAEVYLDANKNCFFSQEILKTYEKEPLIFLGVDGEIPYFALHVKENINNTTKINLRELANENLILETKLGILAQGVSVLNWHDSHQFCSTCGAKTIMARSGWRRDCLTCKKEHFPRTDPVVIMLVTFEDYCLLGRGVNFPANRYSCLAGYMESGESIEDGARRELFEEAGIKGGAVSYIASQPWPFPTTLMIGLHVKALSRELHIDTKEISDARWFHKDDIKKILAGDESFGISTPRPLAIARNLLDWWLAQEA
jgi:NAD+ diphosphatase